MTLEKPEKPLSGSKIDLEKSGVNDVQAETVSIKMGDARDIRAQTVSLVRGGVEKIKAEQVSMRLGYANRIDAGQNTTIRQGVALQVSAPTVEVTQGALGLTQTQNVVCSASALGAVAASGSVALDQSVAKVVGAQQEVSLEQSLAGVVVASKATVESSNVVFLVAGRVEGKVTPLFDWKGALVFGAAFGLVAGVIIRLKNAFNRGEA